mmetsp:Transcript_13492/g.37028  ORF Transcript_13492/g.37028 Transcript_13492/m.37028 type:complete len:207 (-) Transcript_13492:789-1409(-)
MKRLWKAQGKARQPTMFKEKLDKAGRLPKPFHNTEGSQKTMHFSRSIFTLAKEVWPDNSSTPKSSKPEHSDALTSISVKTGSRRMPCIKGLVEASLTAPSRCTVRLRRARRFGPKPPPRPSMHFKFEQKQKLTTKLRSSSKPFKAPPKSTVSLTSGMSLTSSNKVSNHLSEDITSGKPNAATLPLCCAFLQAATANTDRKHALTRS